MYHYRADCDSAWEADINRSTCSLSNDQRIGVYSGLIGSLFVLSALRVVLLFLLLLNAARIVHKRMFSRVLRAPILFFDTNPIGLYSLYATNNACCYRSCIESIFKRHWFFR